MVILSGVFLSILAFFLRVRPRIFQKRFGIDSWYYLLYAQEFRKQKRLPVILPYYLLDIPEQQYPPGLPIALSMFPQKFLENHHWAVAAFIDTVQMAALYFTTYALTSNLLTASLAALFYATSPILVTQNSNLNSRSSGAFVLSLNMLLLHGFALSSNFIYLILVILSGVVLLHTHKLATQQMSLILLGLAVFYLNMIYLFILAGIYLSAFVLSEGYYLKILKGHIEILRFWRRNLPYLGAHQVYESPLYFNADKAKIKKGCGGIAINKFWINMAKLQFVLIFWAIAVYAFVFRGKADSSEIFFLAWFFINIFCITTITYFKPVKFLGEGQRYFTYGIFPASFLLAKFSSFHTFKTVLIITAILIVNTLLIMKIHSEQKKNILAAISDDLLEIVKYIRGLPKDGIMCLPFSYCEYIAYFCRKKTLWGAHGGGYVKLQDFFPILLKPIEYFVQTYGISYCLLNEKYVSIEDLNLSVKYKVIKAIHQYKLIEFVEHG